jgi:hypothetical protein
MPLKILCSGYLVRHPVGGHSWHHLQYLIGFRRLGHEVVFFEDFGWAGSCYDPARDEMGSEPAYGLQYLRALLRPHGMGERWCYLAEDGQVHGMTREALRTYCAECDVYFNLSNMNLIPEIGLCRRRALVDTDPVFTQISAHGAGGPFSDYDVRFTYGENVNRSSCDMPTGGTTWIPTRQPVVLDLWPVTPGNPMAPLTSVLNWTAYGEHVERGRTYGQKDREFQPYFCFPRETNQQMELALNAPKEIRIRLLAGGWSLTHPLAVTRTPFTYQEYIRRSRGEFCVAKHAYVNTWCGWFSDRTAAYLAMGRPAIVQDTGFSRFLPCGQGLLPFQRHDQAMRQIQRVGEDYPAHCKAAREIAEGFFDSTVILTDMLSCCI